MKEDVKIKKWRRLFFAGLAATVLLFMGAKYVASWATWPTSERLALGRQIFEHKWQANDPLAGEGDGLGPVFNANSCVECHFQGGVGGGGTNEFNVGSFEVLPSPERKKMVSGVVHAFATSEVWREDGNLVNRLFPPVKGGTRIINGCEIVTDNFSPVIWSEVNTPPLFGLGLIDKMAGRSISFDGISRAAEAMNRSLEGDFDSIPVGRVRSLPGGKIGRFGWKGQFATLRDFVAAACAVELGLTNPERAQNIPNKYVADKDAKYDINMEQLNALVCFVENLPRPVQVLPDDPQQREIALRGQRLFSEIGCAECHTPNMGGIEGVYCDFRLYDIDELVRVGGYDKPPKELEPPLTHPESHEWKTPPLWGVADSAPYFHDGAAPSLTSAILRHSSQARLPRQAFEKLGLADQHAVVAFLETLKAPKMVAPADQSGPVDAQEVAARE